MATSRHDPTQALLSGSAPNLAEDIYSLLFPRHLELVPQLNETYELELAFYESRALTDEEIIRNGAYFARVGDTLTRHFLMCRGEPVKLPQYSSSRLRSFFETNQFKTGYATHGLFPYRGKFHPQMIKALMNIMGLKPGDVVLDPMMGSGTVLIEARLMGIRSLGIDASPFCEFMTRAKLAGLTLPLAPVRTALRNSKTIFEHFKSVAGQPVQGSKVRYPAEQRTLFAAMEESPEYRANVARRQGLPDDCYQEAVYDFLLLAYLDSAGYSERSNRRPPYEQFRSILERYLFVADKIQRVLAGTESELAEATPIVGDARELPFKDESVDGIIFSPPYSFAIDYLANDSFHLGFMGVEIEELREKMVGLRGSSLREKFRLYVDDMSKIIAECSRVLRPGKSCTIIVGTNNNQLSRILGIAPEKVKGIDEILVEIAGPYHLRLRRKLARQITGMANTMRTEFILILQRE